MKLMEKMTRLHKDIHTPELAKQSVVSVGQRNISDHVLLGVTQGIGNAILTTPLIKALNSMNLKVDIITDGLLNGAAQIFEGMENVELFEEHQIPERIYLLGLQTMWPYKGLEKYVAQVRYAPTPLNLWNVGIKAHEVEANMSLAYSLKYKGDIPSLYCASSPCKIEWPNMNAKQNIGIHVCRRYNHQFHANRQLWDTAGIGKALLDKGHRVFIIGHEDAVDKDQRDKSPEFIYALGMPLPEVASLIKEIDLMINEDSGIMHVTAAMDTPQIALFGPTSHIKNAPWSDRAFVARKGDSPCAPCQYQQWGQDCYKAECMDIDIEYILDVVDDMINNGI